MWRILNALFGWDYIAWSNSCDWGVARVHVAMDSKVWYYRYKSTRLIDRLTDPDAVMWLTCKPEKYFPKKEQ